MRSAGDARGEGLKQPVAYVAAYAFMISAVSYLLNLTVPTHTLSALGVPFAAWAICSGFTNVFWISFASSTLGRGCGTLVALITAGLMLLSGSWFGIPYTWFCVCGILSYLAMGVVTEAVNGGFGNLAALAVNLAALGAGFGAWPSPYIALIAAASYATGWIGWRLGSRVSSAILRA